MAEQTIASLITPFGSALVPDAPDVAYVGRPAVVEAWLNKR